MVVLATKTVRGLYDYLGVMTLDPNNVNAWLLPGTGNKPAKGTISLTPKNDKSLHYLGKGG